MTQSEDVEKKTEPETKKVKNKPKNIVIPPKKPKLSKAERRALQEAQRAAKGQKKNGSDGQKKKKQQAGDAGAKDSKGDEKKEVCMGPFKAGVDLTRNCIKNGTDLGAQP